VTPRHRGAAALLAATVVSVGAVLLMLDPAPLSAAFALGLIGAGYGIVAGLAAGAIAQYWHKNQFGFVAGRSTSPGARLRGSMWWGWWWRGGCRGDEAPAGVALLGV